MDAEQLDAFIWVMSLVDVPLIPKSSLRFSPEQDVLNVFEKGGLRVLR